MIGHLCDLKNAIWERKSKRKFIGTELDDSDYDKLVEFISVIDVPFDHDVEITIHKLDPSESAFYFHDTKFFAAFKGSAGILDQAKVGFVGELFILYAQSIGVSTCWIGHYKKNKVYPIVYKLDEKSSSKKIHCISPLGYSDKKKRISELLFSNRKKKIEEKLLPGSLKEFPVMIYDALALACKAPSAMNCQCWVFNIWKSNAHFTVEISKPMGYKNYKWAYTDIDVGTAAAHFWIGMVVAGKIPKVSIAEELGRAIWRFEIDRNGLEIS